MLQSTGRKDRLKKRRKIYRKYLSILNKNGVVTIHLQNALCSFRIVLVALLAWKMSPALEGMAINIFSGSSLD